MSASRQEKDAPFRWGRWQDYYLSTQTLTPDAARHGYTLLKVRPTLRPAFFVMVDLLRARVRLDDQLPQLLTVSELYETLPQAQAAWLAWQTWTRRFAAYLERLAEGKEGTLPPVPDVLLGLLDEDDTNAR